MLARQVKRGDLLGGRYQVTDVKDQRDPWIPAGHIGLLLFDLLNRRYRRVALRRNDPVDPAALPGWL